ncbi:MAG: MlaD family protein [Halioglobus sp.]
MGNKTNTAAIGAFIVGALIIAVAAILFISGTGWGQDKSKVIMVFDGSVKGLSVGAPVALRGVTIGQVTDIDLIFDTDTIDVIMFVEAEILGDHIQQRGNDNDGDFTEEMIARGLRAQLNSQSLLTGLLYVQLDFHPNSALILAETDSPHTQIPTIPTELQKLSREFESINVSELADNLQSIATGMNAFVSNTAFQQLPHDLQQAVTTIETLSAEITAQIASSGPKIDEFLDSASVTVRTANAEIPRLSASVINTLAELDKALVNFDATVGEVNHLVADDSSTRYELNKALHELALAGRAMQLLAKTLEEQPEAILRGRSDNTP